MAKGGCMNGGDLVTTSYFTPIPWIGLYIAAATLVCLIFMTRDFLHGLIHRKPFLPCKWFQMNALTLTLLQVATKIPVDLTASMPRADDQLSKLTGTALLCTVIGFYMPSLATMDTFERYSNMVALSMIVFTVVVNVCIQMCTGPIFAFATEHIIIIVCMLVLLLFMWSSAIAFGGQIHISKYLYTSETGEVTSDVKDVQELEKLLKKVHVLNYTGNPQSLFCETRHHHAFGLVCVLSFIVVLQATLRSVVFKTMSFCSGVDDYQWSIPFVIVIQLLTIGVGTCSIIYRWYSLICHTDVNVLFECKWLDIFVGLELENLKLKTLSFRVFGKNISAVLQVPKDVIIELLIRTQIMLYGCSKWFIALPIYGANRIIRFITAFFHSSRQHNKDVKDEMDKKDEEKLELSKDKDKEDEEDWAISSIRDCEILENWVLEMARKEYKRWTKKYNERWTKQKNENPIIPFISKWGHMHASKSECFVLGRILDRLYRKEFKNYLHLDTSGYKVSSLSVLVLSRMLKELMPSSSSTPWRDFLKESSKVLDQSFDIIYYVDHKTLGDQKRMRHLLTKNVWTNWKNPKHWFHEIISAVCTFPKNSENSSNDSEQLHHALEFFKHVSYAFDRYHSTNAFKKERPLIREQKMVIIVEISLFCKFILKKKHESIEELFDFLEMSFVKMLCLRLFALPKAILKEIQGDYPYGICEENVREAFKFFYAFKSLEDIVEWSWEDEVLSADEEKDVKSFVDPPDSGAEDEVFSKIQKIEVEPFFLYSAHSDTGYYRAEGLSLRAFAILHRLLNWFRSRLDTSDRIDEGV